MPGSSSNNARRACLALGLAALALAGCGPEYEIDRPGTWRPTGANDANLRAMIADPRDLYTGAAARTERGDAASRAVTRLRTDRRRPLLNASVSRVGPSAETGGDSGGAGGGAGGSAPGAAGGGAP